MKTLVTGANGLLGSNLVRELLQRGHHVRALVRRGSDLTTLQGLGIEFFYGDLLEAKKLTDACRGCDFVIHAGGKLAGGTTKFSVFADTNIRGTQNMVRAAEHAGVSRMVHVSSCCVFGGGDLHNPGTELSEFTGFRFNSGYINSKYLAQQWVLSEIEKKGFPIVIVNPTIMLGPFDNGTGSSSIILRALKQPYMLCPPGGKNFIDVRDVAIACCNSLSRGIPGECYLLAAENLTFADLFNKINRIIHRNNLNIVVAGGLLNCAGLFGNAFRALTSWDIPLNFANTRQLANISYFSAKKAERELGLRQRPVDDAIRDAVAWFISRRYLGPELLQGSSSYSVA